MSRAPLHVVQIYWIVTGSQTNGGLHIPNIVKGELIYIKGLQQV